MHLMWQAGLGDDPLDSNSPGQQAMDQPSSRELFALYKTGDSKAAGEIYDRYVARLIGLVRKRLSSKLGRRVDPEDIVQSAYRSFFLRARDEQYVLERPATYRACLSASHSTNSMARSSDIRRRGAMSLAKNQSHRRADAIEPVAPQPTAVEEVALFEQLEQVMKQLSPLACACRRVTAAW